MNEYEAAIKGLVETYRSAPRYEKNEKRVRGPLFALQHSKMFLKEVLENLPIAVFIKEARELRFVMWNKAGAELIGYSREEMAGKNDYDFFPKEDADHYTKVDRHVLDNELREVMEEKLQTKNRGNIIVRTTKVPLKDENGKARYLLGITEDITERRRMASKLDKLNARLRDASHRAGMAEVATGVLHNVGNVLNSVNVSANLLEERLKKSKLSGFASIAELLKEKADDLPRFFARDSRAMRLPDYLDKFAQHLEDENKASISEIESVRKNIDHIREIVSMQQSYAGASAVAEIVNPRELVEDALRLNADALDRHSIELRRDLEDVPDAELNKHKILQILINLIRNAKYACDDSQQSDNLITMQLKRRDSDLLFSVVDNGIGIAPENLTRIFAHGFTTRKNGHGFGLHSAANTAQELEGDLTAYSEGIGHGAAFTLRLPFAPSKELGSESKSDGPIARTDGSATHS